MTQQRSPDDNARAPIDRTRTSRGGGSIGLVLLVALRAGRRRRRACCSSAAPMPSPIFCAARHARHGRRVLRCSRSPPASCASAARGREPAAQGRGRRRLRRHPGHRPERPRVLCQCRLSRSDRRARSAADVRPVERVFVGDPDVSEAVYRLLKAGARGPPPAGRGRASARIAGEAARWLRMRVRPLGDGKRDARMTVWSIADVTRERERQENVFQELQHAIDYLDHAPAGLLLGRCRRRHRLSQRDAGELARPGSRRGRLRRAQARRHRRRRGRRAADDARRRCRAR